MEKINWTISNITCATCANTITKQLERDGQQHIKVNIADGRVSFMYQKGQYGVQDLQQHIAQLGYRFVTDNKQNQKEKTRWAKILFLLQHDFGVKTLVSFALSIPLLLHMFVHIDFLMNPWLQLGLTLPIYILGIQSFGKSALRSVMNNQPNMEVLIMLGATTAFFYSVFGSFVLGDTQYLYFETTASIMTLIFLGHWLEHYTIQSTQKEIKKLIQQQPTTATMIAFDDAFQEQYFEVEAQSLKVGDLIIVKTGEKVPADAKILWGEAQMNEALVTGESTPINKVMKDTIIGGSWVESGVIKAQVTAVLDDSVLGQIIQYVKDAELEKPPIQNLADKISGVFVPIVLFIAACTFVILYQVFDTPFQSAMMRAIAVLVIACPCALGLATPAAIAVGLGRAARMGILFKQAKSLDLFKQIKHVVFDKTGTLTTGHLTIANYFYQNISEHNFKALVYSIEKTSNHPIAKCISQAWKADTPSAYPFKKITEIKGAGIDAIDPDGNHFFIGKQKHIAHIAIPDNMLNKSVYVTQNDALIGWIDLKDDVRPDAEYVVQQLKKNNIQVYLLSGDNAEKCAYVARQLGIEHVFYEQSPEDKIACIERLTKSGVTVMVGDGINDAPSLAKASIGISINGAAQISLEAASVVLMRPQLKLILQAFQMGRATYQTIKYNLYWAFAYNIVAIPFAAMGYLSPTWSAFIMGGSDVFLALNSALLLVKKIDDDKGT